MSDRMAQLQKLHELDPFDAFLTYGIALEHAKADEPADAVIWLDKTLGLDQNYFYAYFQKAKALSELGEEEEAKAAAREGFERARAAGDEKAAGELGELLSNLEVLD
ncbi:hypothetical protein [Mucisphaera sp.]|uniref:hypothetical protein n=1 Tax=Mucisphaera sp. TaxID=2913024 RepID=UPI003D13F686